MGTNSDGDFLSVYIAHRKDGGLSEAEECDRVN